MSNVWFMAGIINIPEGYLNLKMETAECSLQMFKKIQNYLFSLNEKIGEGSFSQVYRGTNMHNQTEVAVKKVRVSNFKSKIAKRLLECQISILREVNHPSIIKCHDIHFSAHNCYLITELCNGGNVYDLIRKTQKLTQHTIQQIIRTVYDALTYLATLGIVHRDIKASNIFINNGLFKLGDFGFAIKAKTLFKDVSIGSLLYMSPEGLIHNLYGPKTDIWAFGILIFQLYHGFTPLENCVSEEEIKQKVLEPPAVQAQMPSDLQSLMLNCLQINEKERFTINDITNSSFIQRIKHQTELERPLEKDLSLTTFSTSTSSSSSTHLFANITDKQAITVLAYCRLTYQFAHLTKSLILTRCLLQLTKNLSQAKITIQSKDHQDIQQRVVEWSDTVLKFCSQMPAIEYSLKEVANECDYLSQKQNYLAKGLRCLKKESQFLCKSIEMGCLQYFAAKSKCSEYLNSNLK